jgi:hypothetical protein
MSRPPNRELIAILNRLDEDERAGIPPGQDWGGLVVLVLGYALVGIEGVKIIGWVLDHTVGAVWAAQ